MIMKYSCFLLLLLAVCCGGCGSVAADQRESAVEALLIYEALPQNVKMQPDWGFYRRYIIDHGGSAADVCRAAQAYWRGVAASRLKSELETRLTGLKNSQKDDMLAPAFVISDCGKYLIEAISDMEKARIELAGILRVSNSDDMIFGKEEMVLPGNVPDRELAIKIALMNNSPESTDASAAFELIRQVKLCHLALITLEEKIALESGNIALLQKNISASTGHIAALWSNQQFEAECRLLILKRDRIIAWYELLKNLNITTLTAKELFEYSNIFKEAAIELHGKTAVSGGKVSK